VAQHYAPEEVSGAVLATELAEGLASRGHDVTFVTCVPNYPRGRVFEGFSNRLLFKEERNGVRVIRVWSYISERRDFLARLLNYCTFSMFALLGCLKAGRHDVIMSYSPPLFLGGSIALLKRLWRIPWVLRVEDLFPDAAIAVGLLRNRTMIRILRRFENLLYGEADHISLISEGFARNLMHKGVFKEKISVTPVWADPEFVRPMPKENPFSCEHRLVNSFVVLYSGSLGHASALEGVLLAAERLLHVPLVKFIIIGEGVKLGELTRIANRHELKNVRFLPFQPRNRYPEILASADVGLVTLNSRSSNFSLPSKTFNIMAAARPILAFAPPRCELAQLIETWYCGVNVAVGNDEALANTIIKLSQDTGLLGVLGKNGRRALEDHYSWRICIHRIEKMLSMLV